MQRDIAAGREPELDAIAGAVLRAGVRHGLRCPTVEWLAGSRRRAGGIARRLRAAAGSALARRRSTGSASSCEGDRVDHLLLLELALGVVLAVAQDAELAGHAAVGLEHDPGQQLLALLEAETLDVEVGHADPPAVVVGVLTVVGGDPLREPLAAACPLSPCRPLSCRSLPCRPSGSPRSMISIR